MQVADLGTRVGQVVQEIVVDHDTDADDLRPTLPSSFGCVSSCVGPEYSDLDIRIEIAIMHMPLEEVLELKRAHDAVKGIT